jgi:hypothetical protein
MLGTLLGTLPVTDLHDFLDAVTIEDENEDTHWASDKNRFEDWLLNAMGDTSDPECYY